MEDHRRRTHRAGRGAGARRPAAAIGGLWLFTLAAAPTGEAVAQDTGRAWEAVVPTGMERSYERSRYAPAVRMGDLLLLSGIIGFSGGEDNGPEAQFGRAFERLSRVLEGSGLSLDDVAEITTYHVNLGELGRPFITVKNLYFDEPPYPAWTAIGVDRLFLDGALIEIRAVAVIPEGTGG